LVENNDHSIELAITQVPSSSILNPQLPTSHTHTYTHTHTHTHTQIHRHTNTQTREKEEG
jgi:carbohydrate-binding DOMON domain-containing protein